ncbi:unnamed protein product [Prunus brigantina]
MTIYDYGVIWLFGLFFSSFFNRVNRTTDTRKRRGHRLDNGIKYHLFHRPPLCWNYRCNLWFFITSCCVALRQDHPLNCSWVLLFHCLLLWLLRWLCVACCHFLTWVALFYHQYLGSGL